MRPAQMRTQCVRIWIHEIEFSHHLQISYIKPFSKFSCQLIRKKVQQTFTVFCTFIFTAGNIDLFADLPISLNHRRIDSRVYLALSGDNAFSDICVGFALFGRTCVFGRNIALLHIVPSFVTFEVSLNVILAYIVKQFNSKPQYLSDTAVSL